MRTLLVFVATLGLWAQVEKDPNPAPAKPPIQADPNAKDPAARPDPVSKTGPVSAVAEPELACAGNRSELLDYPNPARSAHVEASVVADFSVTPEGKLKEVKLQTTTPAADKASLFEDAVRLYLQQSDFPPGCEKEMKQLRFEFFFKGDPAPERKSTVEFKTPNTYLISVNPDISNTPLPNSADRKKKSDH